MQAINNFLRIIYVFLRPFIKWFLHRFTRLCELQRICYGETAGSCRSKEVERSLNLSKNVEIKKFIRKFDEQIKYCNDEEFKSSVRQAVILILRVKKIKPAHHPDFSQLFGQCVEQIWGYKRLLIDIENLRTTQYDAENSIHERKLLDLWSFLVPDSPLESRITKQWQEIGFQGDDPKTDFRGMGLLGLDNLLYFSKEYNNAARHVLLHSMHPSQGYTFAIVGINLTSMAYNMVNSGKAKTHFFNVTKTRSTVEHFHKFYCYLFFEFDRFWMECEPRNIMDFPVIHQSFEANIKEALEDDKTVFKTNLVVEHI